MNDQAGDPSLWQSGLRFANGSPKTNVYNNFRLPILVRQLGPGAVEVRGDARPGGAGAIGPGPAARPRGAVQEPRRRDRRSATSVATSSPAT